jgi:glycosyltransferase involved in cell wall biosynthesis
MKIAIDVSPLSSGHKVRGVGFYLEHLRDALVNYFPENEYVFFETGEKLPADIDLVHFPYFEPFFLELPLYKKFKTVVTVHDLTPIVFPEAFPRGIKGELKWQMQRYALRQADSIITDSESSKKDVVRFVGVKENKVKVVYLAAGEQFKVIHNSEFIIHNLRKKYNLPDRFLLYVGDVTWNKNLPRLLDAVSEAKIPLVMVGKSLVSDTYDKGNPWNADLVKVQSKIEHQTSNGKDKVIRLGFVPEEDLVAIYNLATAAIMPSLYEGFGLPVLEAMACGCPVITSKEGSLSEVAGDSAAYFVDAYDVKSITEGIKRVFSDNSLQKQLSEKGLENVKLFSWNSTAAQTLKVYESILKA